ncbi:MAG: SLC13 family permease [Candidatus Falkowbacteria bacterium]|nr:SLC13 family permease [Candidatus Falkowbacteria bacterium]
MSNLILIALIFLTAYFVIKPTVFFRSGFQLNLVTAPILVLLFTILFGLVDFNTIAQGILGSGTIIPWKVLIIFFGSAFISISADKSGIFDHISVLFLNKARGRGVVLFVITYCFAWFLSVFASNDIVILTLTPIVFYFSIYSNVNVIPLLFAEFIAANNGIFFITGNPVDTIIATSLNIDQTSYIINTISPTIVLSLVSLVLLFLYFRKVITKNYKVKNLLRSVRNWFDAKLSMVLLIAVIACLLISSYLKMDLWLIVLCGFGLFVIKDLFIPFLYHHKLFESAHGKLWRIHQTIVGMPWDILPFILTMFILMVALDQNGFFNIISIWLTQVVQTSSLKASLVFGVLSLLTENMVNNQPMAIMFSHIFTNANLQISPKAFKAGLYAVILAGNAGASLTMVGALAGLMWQKILRHKGMVISYWDFTKVGLFVVLPSVIISFFVLAFTL